MRYLIAVPGRTRWLARVGQGPMLRDSLPRLLTMARDFVLICATVAAVALAVVVVTLTSLTLVGLLFSVPFAATLIDAFR